MKPKKIHLGLPTHCTQNWHAMPETERGKFCAQCNQHLIDFTDKTDQEIFQVFSNKQKNEKICGKFRSSQLNKTYVLEKKRIGKMPKVAYSLLILGALTSTACETSKKSVNQTSLVSNAFNQDQNATEDPDGQLHQGQTKNVVAGTVLDSLSNAPLEGIQVSIEGQTKKTVTDKNGKFSLEVEPAEGQPTFTLIFSDHDFLPIRYALNRKDLPIKKNFKLELALEMLMLGEPPMIDERD